MSVIKPNSKITLHNPDTDTTANISVEQIMPGRDSIIKIKPTNNNYITEKRLDIIKRNISEYLKDPSLDKTITPPTIISYRQESEHVIFKLQEYTSNIMLPYCGVKFMVSTTQDFSSDIIVEEIVQNLDIKEGLKISVAGMKPKVQHYIKVNFLGGGYVSNDSNVFSFTPTFPTIDKPEITGVVYNYNQVAPYTTTLNITSSRFNGEPGITHISTSWKIYKKVKDDVYDIIYNIDEDTNNLTSIVIRDIIPSKVSHGDEFLVSCQYHGSSQTYSLESDKYSTRSLGILVKPTKSIDIYPIELNISDLTFIVDNEYYISIDGVELQQSLSDLESFEWELETTDLQTTIKKFTSTSNKFEIPAGEIFPGRTYKIRNRYKHKILGYSEFKETTFTTKSEFVSFSDKLSVPIKTTNDSAYFGEIPWNQLMSENVKYRGEYEPTLTYNIGDEIKKEGEYYICVEQTTSANNFDRCFKKSTHSSSQDIYKSGLPTMTWLLNNIGLNPYLNNTDDNYHSSSLINETSGWIKVRNSRKQILYIAKKPIMNNISINDLIDKDLFHPRRKTVRIGDNLYYIRILVSNLEVGYDSLDPLYTGENFNDNYRHSEPIDYNEDELLIQLMNSKLSTYDPVDLEMPLTYKEIIYNVDNIYSYKLDQSGGQVSISSQIIPYADERNLTFRPVLELIPPENHPFKNISTRLPKSLDTVENDGLFNPEDYYDKYLDAGYLGYVSVDDLITSEALDLQTGLNSNKSIPIMGWYKFYYRGLVYFVPNGVNFKNITYTNVLRNNMLTPTPRFNYNVSSDKIKFGKIFHNGIIYNTNCPNGIKYTNIREIINNNGNKINLFTNSSPTIDPDFCYDAFLSDVIYPVLSNIVVDRTQPGYKGRYKKLKSIELMDQFGNGTTDDSSFLLSDVVKYSNGTDIIEKAIINNQKIITRIEEKSVTDMVDAIICLNVNPIFDKPELW